MDQEFKFQPKGGLHKKNRDKEGKSRKGSKKKNQNASPWKTKHEDWRIQRAKGEELCPSRNAKNGPEKEIGEEKHEGREERMRASQKEKVVLSTSGERGEPKHAAPMG